jgi:hypothetical protein
MSHSYEITRQDRRGGLSRFDFLNHLLEWFANEGLRVGGTAPIATVFIAARARKPLTNSFRVHHDHNPAVATTQRIGFSYTFSARAVVSNQVTCMRQHSLLQELDRH